MNKSLYFDSISNNLNENKIIADLTSAMLSYARDKKDDKGITKLRDTVTRVGNALDDYLYGEF